MCAIVYWTLTLLEALPSQGRTLEEGLAVAWIFGWIWLPAEKKNYVNHITTRENCQGAATRNEPTVRARAQAHAQRCMRVAGKIKEFLRTIRTKLPLQTHAILLKHCNKNALLGARIWCNQYHILVGTIERNGCTLFMKTRTIIVSLLRLKLHHERSSTSHWFPQLTVFAW